jgi:hypothetical protein
MGDVKFAGEVAQLGSAPALGAGGPGFESQSCHQSFVGKTVRVEIVDPGGGAPFAGAFLRPDAPGEANLVVALNMTFLAAGYADETPEAKKRYLQQSFADTLAHELIHACEYVFGCAVSEATIERACAKARGYPVEEADLQARENDLTADNIAYMGMIMEFRELIKLFACRFREQLTYGEEKRVEAILEATKEVPGDEESPDNSPDTLSGEVAP